MNNDHRPYTIFCDIDGTLTKQATASEVANPEFVLELLPGVIQKLKEWDQKGYNIILTTGRKESMRFSTESQLKRAGIFYDKLIMGIGGGKRFLINNFKIDSDIPYAISINIPINTGLLDIEI